MRWGSCEYVLHRYSLFFVTIVLRRDWFWCDKESVGYFFDDDVKDTEFYDGNKKRQPRSNGMVVLLVRVKGLEPLRRKTPDPKSGASAIPPHSQVPVHFITFFWLSVNWKLSLPEIFVQKFTIFEQPIVKACPVCYTTHDTKAGPSLTSDGYRNRTDTGGGRPCFYMRDLYLGERTRTGEYHGTSEGTGPADVFVDSSVDHCRFFIGYYDFFGNYRLRIHSAGHHECDDSSCSYDYRQPVSRP